MNVYLLPQKSGKYKLFSSDFGALPVADSQENPNENSPLDIPVEEKNYQKIWRKMQEGYHKVNAKRDAREKMLKNSGIFDKINLHYNPQLSAEDALNLYEGLVEAQVKKHRKWMFLDGALVPLGVLLTIVPGPNIFLAYVAWRTMAHYKIQKGGKKGLESTEIDLFPEDQLYSLEKLLSKRFSLNRKKQLNDIGIQLGIENLGKMYSYF